MPAIRLHLPTALLAGLLITGCASIGDIFGGDEPYDRITEVRGTVERVSPRDALIYVEGSSVYRSNLRNDEDEVALHYDDRTVVEYGGRTYEPQELEPGDRIVAAVDDTGGRLVAREIEVTYDVSSGGAPGEERAELRGFVRSLDTRDRVLSIEDADWRWGFTTDDDDEYVSVYYDSSTIVEYQGQRYTPESLERGDEVEVAVRDLGDRYLAEEIVVLASVRD
jgi:hypothetical protein